VSFSRFIESVEKARLSLSKNKTEHAVREDADYFFIKTDGRNKYRRVAVDEIIYVESIKNYIVIHTPNEQIVTYNTLRYFEENLPDALFVKIHKSYIVALNKIESTDNNLIMIMKKSLPLGDTYRNEFFGRINQKKL
jgi:DNA-binding LytR/AlgR family response regulator